MPKTHVCAAHWGDIEVLAQRLILARAEHDEDAYNLVINEIEDCPTCLVNVLHHAIHGWMVHVALKVGGHAATADIAAETIERYV